LIAFNYTRNALVSLLPMFLGAGLLALITVESLFPHISNPRPSPNSSPSADVLLEVTATHSTMQSEDTYIYLRVFSDGTAECQSSRHANPDGEDRYKKTLTQDEFGKLKTILDEPGLRHVRTRYETRYAIVDTSTEWVIKIRRTGRPQIIEVLEFSPALAKIMKHPYPSALVKLGCTVQKVRSDVSGESAYVDSECKRILEIH